MIDKVVLENCGTLDLVPECCKNQKMSNKVVDNYSHVSEFVPNCYKTQCIYKILPQSI